MTEVEQAKFPYMPFFVSDWLSDEGVRFVTPAARGMWMDMLCFMWKSERQGYLEINGKPIPPAALCRMCGVPENEGQILLEQLRAANVFSEKDGVIFSRRMVSMAHIRAVRAQSGARGGKARLLKQSGKQNESKQSSKSEANSNYNLTLTSAFQLFYRLYPRKKSKGAAEKAFKAATKIATVEQIMAGLDRYVKECQGKDPSYIKFPATWLNQQCWNDEPDAPPVNANAWTPKTDLSELPDDIFESEAGE